MMPNTRKMNLISVHFWTYLRGWGLSKAKIFKGKYETKLELPEGWGLKPKKLSIQHSKTTNRLQSIQASIINSVHLNQFINNYVIHTTI